ncbi:hypothetical protein [Winogradskyella endarachnes]|uniref:Uncharacterized protein n=1 Tax=Winogradskyella endarachnes TaxID=2681965 RepID=A0A6L6U7T8_9FLAO|nr:hypothetical protein [Winogradskyella endarachnes]MUU76894.1 hypothetical protein [Winogradskyella endarachnes]
MKDLKKIKIYTILIHCFIIIGVGHGIGILLVLDYLSVQSLFNNEIIFNLSGNYQDRLELVGLISFIGKIILIVSFFVSRKIFKNTLNLVGVIVLWISVYILTSGNWSYDGLYPISFITSVPFIIASLFLVYYTLMSLNKRKSIP